MLSAGDREGALECLDWLAMQFINVTNTLCREFGTRSHLVVRKVGIGRRRQDDR